MKNVVMKFGGTSVADADAIRRLIAIVSAQAARTGAPPVVVVSAMSKVTDQLLRMTADASRGERATISSGVDESGSAIWRRSKRSCPCPAGRRSWRQWSSRSTSCARC